MEKAGKISVSRFRELLPHWSQHGGTGPRTATTTLVGGPPPYHHRNRDKGIVSENCAGGTMLLPIGCTQPLHRHPVDEIYVVARGRVSFRSDGGTEVEAEPFDCMLAPSGVYHAAKNIGEEDAWIIWFHAGLCRSEDFEFWPDETT